MHYAARGLLLALIPCRHMKVDTASAMDLSTILLFFHSLLRWGILVTVAVAAFSSLAGWLGKRPVMTWQRAFAIWAMVLCHVQLILGFILYFMRWDSFQRMGQDQMRFWKFEHAGMMVVAIALVTIGRLASKKARTENGKHQRVAIFYLIALVLMLAMIPWPFMAVGEGRGWL